MSLRKKLASVAEATKEGAAIQWRDFLGLDWKWALAYFLFIPLYALFYLLGKLIGQ